MTQKASLSAIFPFWCLHALWKSISEAACCPMHFSIPVTHGSPAASPSPCVLSAPHLPPCLCSAFVLLSVCLWWTHCRFCCWIHLPQWIQPLLADLSCPKCQFSVHAAVTVIFNSPAALLGPQPTSLTLSYIGGHPVVRLPVWKTGGF